jgi:hypothetical protein
MGSAAAATVWWLGKDINTDHLGKYQHSFPDLEITSE